MKEHEVLMRILTEYTILHQMMSRLQMAYEVFKYDEQLLEEVENLLEIYRKLKKESESEE